MGENKDLCNTLTVKIQNKKRRGKTPKTTTTKNQDYVTASVGASL